MIGFGTSKRAALFLGALAACGWLLTGGLHAGAAQTTACVGDCNGDGEVTVNEIITMVNITLGSAPASACTAADPNGDGVVSIADIIAAVNNSLDGCGGPVPTPTPTARPPIAEPGLESTITGVTIATDPAGQITTTFTLTDGNGTPLTPVLGQAASSEHARVRLTIAHEETYAGGGEMGTTFTRYVNDIDMTRPRYDSGGTLQTVDAASGVYRYIFKTQLPADFDRQLTYSVGMQVDRTVAGQQLGVNPVYDFVPAGGTPIVRADVSTQACNSCHAPLIAHGNRREVRLCQLCHTEAAVDEKGTTVDLRNMIHKIHAGKQLPSIVGGAPGTAYALYSSFARDYAVFAQKEADGRTTGVGFPRWIEECTVCHTGGTTPEYYKTKPSTAACATCHDNVNPSPQPLTIDVPPRTLAPGEGHFVNAYFPDGQCTVCHVPDTGVEFDISVVGAHVVPERSKQLKGLNVAITGVTNHAAGQIPTIVFTVTNNAGVVPTLDELKALNRVAFAMSGPTTDYEAMIVYVAVGGGASGNLTGPDQSGTFQYTPTTPIPATATGTWSVGAEARREVQLSTAAPIAPKVTEEAAVNPVVSFTVDTSTAMMRRVVVEDQRCSSCHGQFSRDFSIHGNLRNRIEYCVICHNPNQNDAARRRLDPNAVADTPPGLNQTATIDFKVMIHKIHTGEGLAQKPYLIYGFGPPAPAGTGYTVVDFADVRFPGQLRNCETCHLPGTSLMPPYPGTALSTRQTHLEPVAEPTPGSVQVEDPRIPPITAACTSCHDDDASVAHATTQTTDDGDEACTVCHDEGAPFSVSISHRP